MNVNTSFTCFTAIIKHISRVGPAFILGSPMIAFCVLILARNSGIPSGSQAMKVIVHALVTNRYAFSHHRRRVTGQWYLVGSYRYRNTEESSNNMYKVSHLHVATDASALQK